MGRYDPARLLRQSWASADELARELYVAMTDERRAESRPTPDAAPPLSAPPTSTPSGAFRPVAAIIPRAQPDPKPSPGLATTPTPSGIPPSAEDARRQAAEFQPRHLTDAGPLPPPRTSGAIPQPDAPLIRAVSLPLAPSSLPQARPLALAAQDGAIPQRRVLGLEQTPSPAFRRQAVPGPSPTAAPAELVALRDLVSSVSTGGLPTAAETYSPTAVPTPTPTAPLDLDHRPNPAAAGIPAVQRDDFALDALDPGRAPASHRDTEAPNWTPHTERIPPYSFGRMLCQVAEEGIPGATPGGTGTTILTPGEGDAYILDFDGAELRYFNRDRNQVFNTSPFPVSGGTYARVFLVGNHLFLEPVHFVHAIVATTIGPVSGTTPDTAGTATCYYRSNGVLIPDTAITVENWYTVTAAVGKHCGLMEIGGVASLEVLDC